MHRQTGWTTIRHRLWRGGAATLVLVVAACGGGDGSAAPPTTTPPISTTVGTGAVTSVVRGAPRWETITTLKGDGAAEPPAFTVLADSIQWRTRWKCTTGQLRITTDPPPRRPGPMVDAACPGAGEGFAIVNGEIRLRIEASGPWEVIADQQVDTPLNEAPLEGMAAAPVLSQGTFYSVEKMAKGTAKLSKRADGATILRLEDFEVSTNVDLFLWLSEAVAPKSSADAVAAPYVVLGNLKSTVGNQNYVLPTDLSVDKIKSLVIWCDPVRVAYGVASLTPPS